MLLWPPAYPPFWWRGLASPADLVTEVPVALSEHALCGILLLSLFAVKTKSPSTKQALSVETQILPLVSEVISILMEIHIYGLSSILLIQCTYNNAFHIIIALLCEYKFRLPVHNMLVLPELSQQDMTMTVKLRHFWPSVKSLLHFVLFLVSFYIKWENDLIAAWKH